MPIDNHDAEKGVPSFMYVNLENCTISGISVNAKTVASGMFAFLGILAGFAIIDLYRKNEALTLQLGQMQDEMAELKKSNVCLQAENKKLMASNDHLHETAKMPSPPDTAK